MKDFFKDLKRRKVWQVMIVYAAVAWGLVQVADTVLPMFGAPDWVLKSFTVLLGLGFPVAVVFAWVYDLTPGGIKATAPLREIEPQKTQSDTSSYLDEASSVDQTSGQANESGSKSWIAVMPFKVPADDPEAAGLGDGLIEDLCAGLARFPYLAVVARESLGRKAGETRDVREFSKALGARYVIEGSVRHLGETVRVSVRLIEASAGVSLWAENYTRDLRATTLFEAEDEITNRIVATLADSFGVLVASMTRLTEEKPESELTPNDWVLRTFDYLRTYLPHRHLEVRDGLEKAVEQYPRSAELWACLAHLYLNEYNFGFNQRPDPLDRALKAAAQAFELDNASQLASQQLAQVHFFRRDLVRFRAAAERAIALNSLDTNTLGILGLLFVHARDFERGTELTQRAMELNENHAHWCHFSWIWYHFARGDYEEALERVSMVNISGNFWIPLAAAAIYVQLGQEQHAREAVAELLALDPDFGSHARFDIEAWHYGSGLADILLDALAKAGLEID